MRLLLTRFAYTPMGTFGRLYYPEFECFTVERPWMNNQRKVSCIPEGTYPLMAGRFNRGGYDTWEVMQVPGRSLIKFHVGNTMDDLLGCIAPGKGLGWVDGKWAVTRSREAFREFMAGSDFHELEITWIKQGS